MGPFRLQKVLLTSISFTISILWEEQQDTLGADYKTNAQIAKDLEITPVLDKLLEYKRNWIQHVNRIPRDRLPRIMKHYSPTGRRNRGRPLKRLLDTWDRNGSTSGLTQWQTYDDDYLYFMDVHIFIWEGVRRFLHTLKGVNCTEKVKSPWSKYSHANVSAPLHFS